MRTWLFLCALAAAAAVTPAAATGAPARAAATGPVATAAAPPQGPAGRAFYRPPERLVAGPHGTVIWTRPARGLVEVPGARRTLLVLYRSRATDGRPTAVSGSVAIPKGTPPRGGWPIVSWGHMTTGGADGCAPTRARRDSPELERMLRGRAVVERLVRTGVAVARSDYEGLGTPGPHPYLIGTSLGRSLIDIVRAARAVDRIGTRWAAAGHSEGGQAALFAAAAARAWAPELRLRGAVAMAPANQLSRLVELARAASVAGPAVAELSALGGLILDGARVADPSLDGFYRAGGLSPRALALLPQVRRRCLTGLTRPDSWGALAPAAIAGEGADVRPLYRVLDAHDAFGLRIAGTVVRIDQGDRDGVVFPSFTDGLVAAYRRRGTRVVYRRHPGADHVTLPRARFAAAPAAAWLRKRLGNPSDREDR